MMNKKGQTATEYMIILAVVIIIALIVVGVLGGIPGIGGGAGSRALDAYWSTAPIGVVSAAAASSDNMARLIIKNNLNDPIMIHNVSLSPNGQSDAETTIYQAGELNITYGVGEEKVWNGTVVQGGVEICNSPGDSWISNIYVEYTNQRTGATFEFRGEGNQLSGVCATSIN